MTQEEFLQIPDEELQNFSFSMPWQYNPDDTAVASNARDADGFRSASDTSKVLLNRSAIQDVCWEKFNRNPQINTSVRGIAGRLAGYGFQTVSDFFEINEFIKKIETDPRNRLYNFWPKFVGRASIEGELFHCLTLHEDGFVEVDYIDPVDICDGFEEGIMWHPTKPCFPLFYNVGKKASEKIQIPSIYIALYPDLLDVARKVNGFDELLQKGAKSRRKQYSKIAGYKKFVISWDKSWMTRRTVSFLVTTIMWINHYESLKKYEIDHKRSAGAYLWVFTIKNPAVFKMWLSLTDEERRKTGIVSKKVPGGSIVLPEGIELEVKNPQLPKITEQDNDILQMIASGLNEPEDVLMGTSKGSTYASVKATRGPMTDRISDEIAYFERYLRYDFWRSIFFLSSVVSKLPKTFKRRECVGYEKTTEIVEEPVGMVKMAEKSDGKAEKKEPKMVPQPTKKVKREVNKPIFKEVDREPHELIDFVFPISETVDFESRARGLLGVKHGSVVDVLGIPKSTIAKKLGLSGYGYLRQQASTEDDTYPETIMNVDAESVQERVEAEPKRSKIG